MGLFVGLWGCPTPRYRRSQAPTGATVGQFVFVPESPSHVHVLQQQQVQQLLFVLLLQLVQRSVLGIGCPGRGGRAQPEG